MITVFWVLLPLVICLASGIAIGWSLARLRAEPVAHVQHVQVPRTPSVPVVVRADGAPLTAEDLVGVRYLLHAAAHRWMAYAFDQVVADQAAEEASEGLDEALARIQGGER